MDLELQKDLRIYKVTSASGDNLILVEKRKCAPAGKCLRRLHNDDGILEVTSMNKINLFTEEDFSLLCLTVLDNSNVGFVHYYTTTNKLEFSDLVVREDCRGKGYGKILVTALERTALSENLEFVEAGVRCAECKDEKADYNKRIKFYKDLKYIVKPAIVNKSKADKDFNPILKNKKRFLKAECQKHINLINISDKFKEEISVIKGF